MSWDQNSGWSQNINIDNTSFESVEEFKYMGQTTLISKFRFGRNSSLCPVLRTISQSALQSWFGVVFAFEFANKKFKD